MTKQEIEQLQILRSKGVASAEIAARLGISVNTVRSYIHRHPLPDVLQSACLMCGNKVLLIKGKKAKKFCSDKCRNQWWNTHTEQIKKKAYYRLVCEYCGKEFESYGNKNRKFCSRACYAEARRVYSIPSSAHAD